MDLCENINLTNLKAGKKQSKMAFVKYIIIVYL